jgi:hypothetical protein
LQDNIQAVAAYLARWLSSRAGVGDVQVVIPPPLPRRSKLPRPPFLTAPASPAFELHLTYKGERRVLRYFIEAIDDLTLVCDTLKVHTNGELMVRVPDEYGSALRPNDIYYGNRSSAGAVLGDTAGNRQPPS